LITINIRFAWRKGILGGFGMEKVEKLERKQPRKQPEPSPRNCGSPGAPKAASRLLTPTGCLPVSEQSG